MAERKKKTQIRRNQRIQKNQRTHGNPGMWRNRRRLNEDLEEIESEVDKYLAGVPDESDDLPPGISQEDFNNLSPEDREKLKAEMPLPAKVGVLWQDFVVNTGESVQQMREEMHQNYLKRLQRVRNRKKISQSRRLERIEEREKRITARYELQVQDFEEANNEINENLVEMKKTLYSQKAEKRDVVLSNRAQRQAKRAELSNQRQKKFKHAMKAVNKWGWRQQLKIILIIVPLLAALVIVFMLLRPFLGI